MKTHIFPDVNEIYSGTVRPYVSGQVGYSLQPLRLKKQHKDHVPVISFGNTPKTIIDKEVRLSVGWNTISPNIYPNIYVEPKARITRDLLRSTGYNIKMDRNAADLCVIPEFKDNQIDYWSADFVMYDKGTKNLYMITLKDKDVISYDEETANDIFTKFGSALSKSEKEFYCNEFKEFNVYFIPRVESYLELVQGNISRRYVFDNKMPFTPVYEINIENLEIWSHITDMTLLEKCIIGSDWQKYPFTLFTFLSGENQLSDILNQQNRNLRMIMDEVCAQYMNYPNDKVIEPEDWNMSQKWCFHRLGLEDCEASFVDKKDFDGLNSYYRSIIRTRFAVAPLKINTPISFKNIKQLL